MPNPRSCPESTRFACFSRGLLEACCLLAVVSVPLFYNLFSGRPFEGSKVCILRMLVAVMAAAGCVVLFEEDKLQWKRLLQFFPRPVLAAIVVYLAVTLIRTLFSVTPRISFWGSYGRLGGMLTTLVDLLVFAAVAGQLRGREQIGRLVDTALLTSVPVCLYGLIQRFGLDPVGWQSLFLQQDRAFSTLGNPIFAGAYLILVLPLTLARALGSSRRSYKAFCGFAALLQLLVLFYTGSRGPWLGGLAGLAAFLLLAAGRRGPRRRGKITTVALLGLAAFLVTLNVPNGPLEPLRRTRLLSRIGHLYEARETDPSLQGRRLMWRGVYDLVRPHEPLRDADGNPDRWNSIRPWIGYGPETLGLVFHAVSPPELDRVLRPGAGLPGGRQMASLTVDSAHNAIMDSLASGGVLGVLAHLLLYSALFYQGLRTSGHLTTALERRACGALYLGTGALGGGLAVALWGPEYLVVGLPAGLVSGLLGYLAWAHLRPSPPAPHPGRKSEELLVAACFAALLGHFLEIQFGLTVVTSELYFWVLAGLLLGLSRLPAAEARQTPRRGISWRDRSTWVQALVATAVLITLSYDFLAPWLPGSLGPLGSVFKDSDSTFWVLLLLLSLSWLASWPALRGGPGSGLLGCLLAALLFCGFGALHRSHLAGVDDLDFTRQGDPVKLADSLAAPFSSYSLWLLALAVALAPAISQSWPERTSRRLEIGVGLSILLFGSAFLGGVLPQWRAIRADIYHYNAEMASANGYHVGSVPLHRLAILLAPREDLYYLALARSLQSGATLAPGSAADRRKWFEVAEKSLEKAQVLSPFEANHTAGRARLAAQRAELATDPEEREALASRADQLWQAALRLSPSEVLYWNEWAQLDLFLGNDSEAERKLKRALGINPELQLTNAALEELYLQRARKKSGEETPRPDASLTGGTAARQRRIM